MSAVIIDGKALAAKITNQIKQQLIEAKLTNPPGLAVILIGNNPASAIYVNNKRKACSAASFNSKCYQFKHDIQQSSLQSTIQQLNQDPQVNGILIQLPLPSHINTDKIIEIIDPHKDVDGFHPYNIGKLAQRQPTLRPCTPMGIMRLMQHYNIPIKGQHAVIVGASNLVGRPMALELLLAGATVTVCHRFTKNLANYCQQADILISATGKPELIQATWVKPKATVIDVGICRQANGKIIGDVNFDQVRQVAGYLTPVPGGVGPLTVAMLLENTLQSAIKYDSTNNN